MTNEAISISVLLEKGAPEKHAIEETSLALIILVVGVLPIVIYLWKTFRNWDRDFNSL